MEHIGHPAFRAIPEESDFTGCDQLLATCHVLSWLVPGRGLRVGGGTAYVK